MPDRTERRPGPPRTLTQDDIVAAALKLLDDGGSPALTMRAVATATGVTPNALYTYFPTKATLIGVLTDGLLGRVDRTVLTDHNRPWRDRIRRFATDLRAVLLAHPATVPLLMSAPFDGPHALSVGEDLLDALTDISLSREDAARASYLLTTYVFGTVALDVAEQAPGGVTVDEPTRTAARRASLTVPSEQYPHTAASADVIAAYNTTDQYLWGLERLLDGIVASDVAESSATCPE